MIFEIRFTDDLAAGLAPGDVSIVTPILLMRVRNLTRAYEAGAEEQRVLWNVTDDGDIVTHTNPNAFMTVVRHENMLLGISRSRANAVKFAEIVTMTDKCIIVKQCSRLRQDGCRDDATIIHRGLFMALENCLSNLPLKFPYKIIIAGNRNTTSPSSSPTGPSVSPSQSPSLAPQYRLPSARPTISFPSASPTASPEKARPTFSPSANPLGYNPLTAQPTNDPTFFAPSMVPSVGPIRSWQPTTVKVTDQGAVTPPENRDASQVVNSRTSLWALLIIPGFFVFSLLLFYIWKLRKKTHLDRF